MFHNFLLQVERRANDSNCVVLEVSAVGFRVRVDVDELLEFYMLMSAGLHTPNVTDTHHSDGK